MARLAQRNAALCVMRRSMAVARFPCSQPMTISARAVATSAFAPRLDLTRLFSLPPSLSFFPPNHSPVLFQLPHRQPVLINNGSYALQTRHKRGQAPYAGTEEAKSQAGCSQCCCCC